MAPLPVVLLHGYSDGARSLEPWRAHLLGLGHPSASVRLCEYVSLSNELNIKDIAEAFDRALALEAGLRDAEPFDAIVHSTGMLVIRSWLASAPQRRRRLKHLIALAPASFGSPMAHKGRSWLGAIFKGGKQPGPDFLEAGDRILAALELGSPFTWELAHRDLVGEPRMYGAGPDSPFAFVFVGLEDYGWLKRAVTEPGTDGTVRWAGAGLNVRKIVIDLSREVRPDGGGRVSVAPWRNGRIPLVLLPDLNHGSILRAPSPGLLDAVDRALRVENAQEYDEWARRFEEASDLARRRAAVPIWQQFVTRALDERGDPIDDYFVEVCTATHRGRRLAPLSEFDLDVHACRDAPSYRCFHVSLNGERPAWTRRLYVRLIASSGTELVGYHGHGGERFEGSSRRRRGKWDAVLDLTAGLAGTGVDFFFPYTTTLVELRLNREPMPLAGPNRVMRFVGR